MALVAAPDAGGQETDKLADLLAASHRQERAGQIDQAAESRKKAISLLATEEERATQWIELGDLYLRANKPHLEAQARAEALKHLVPYDPRHWPTVERLLFLYREQLDRPGSAVALLESLTAGLEPGRGDLRAWMELASTRHRMGETDWASTVYHALARRTSPGSGEMRRRLMVALGFCKRFSPGEASFNRNLGTAALIGRLRSRLGEKRWDEAADCIAELLTRFPDAVMDADGVVGTGPRTVVAGLLAGLTPASKKAYEETLARPLAKVIHGGRIEEIERFARTHPWPAFRPALMIAAGDALLAEERFSRAAACYRSAASATTEPAQRREALIKAARAAILAGEPVPANLPAGETVTIAGETVTITDAVARWQKDIKHRGDETVPPVALSAMKHDRLRLLQAPLALRKWQAGWQTDRDGQNPVMTAAFVPYVLAGDRSQVFINTSEMLYAIDPVAEKLLWTRGPSELFTAELLPPSLKRVRLSNTPKRFYTATSADTLFFRLNWADRTTQATRSAIFAARRSDGALRWSTEGLSALAGMRFVSDPAYGCGTVVAATWEPREIPVFHLVGLDAVTGELLWKTHLFSGTMFPAVRGAGLTDAPLGSAPPTIAGSAVYFVASTGVLACLDLLDGHVRWLQTYPRIHEYGRVAKESSKDSWAGRFIFNRPNAPVIVRGNLVLAAPQDFRGILFFDAESGRLVRQYESIDFRVLIGADDARAYIQQGGAVAAVQLADASVAWETMLPASMVIGSPAMSKRGIICATKEGLFVLSPDDGRIVDERPPVGWEPVGNPFDLGDRILAVSPVAVHVLAARVNGGKNWSMPRSPEPTRLTVEVSPPQGLTRWALPAPDRGDFFLSEQAPDLMVIRTWESFQLRRVDPAPTLLWEYAGPSWPRTIQFDDKIVLFDYTHGRLIGVDVRTGKPRWELRDAAMAGERGTGGAIVAGDLAVWFNRNRVRGVNTGDGQSGWSAAFEGMTIRGICPHAKGVGVFLENGAGPLAVLLDRKTGSEIRRIPLVKPRRTDKNLRVVRCARADGQNVVAALPIALIDGYQIAMVDFSAGRVELKKVDRLKGETWLVRCGDVLCMVGRGGLIAARSLRDFKPLSIHPAGLWRIADGIEYYAHGPRIFAWDTARGEPVWQTRAFTWQTRLLVVAGNTLLAAQDLPDEDSPQARVIAIDRTNGDVVAKTLGLARQFHKVGDQGESLYGFDLGYLYRFGEPRKATQRRQRVTQEGGDVEAIAAVKLARDMETGLLDTPPAGRFTPTIDADLTDWQDATWVRLQWPGHWQPDHVLLSSTSPRRLTSSDDLSAAIALAQGEEFVCLAARVHDGTHDAAIGRPLWCGDSLRVIWWAGDRRSGRALAITAAVVDHVPCIELGDISNPTRVMPDTGVWPPWLKSILWEKDVPWLRRWQSGSTQVPGIRFAARRDEAADQTAYELAVSVDLLPAARGADRPLLWDVMINDADGSGREGALELGTAFLQLEHPVGFAQWPAYDQETGREN